jgi:hypothetical protein
MSNDLSIKIKNILGRTFTPQYNAIDTICKIIVKESPLPDFTKSEFMSDKQKFHIIRSIDLPVKEILANDNGFEALLYIFGNCGLPWLFILEDILRYEDTVLPNCLSLIRKTTSEEDLKRLLLFTKLIKNYQTKNFVKAFLNQLYVPTNSYSFCLTLRLIDKNDSELIGPLNKYLLEVKTMDRPKDRKQRSAQKQIIREIESAIRRIEGIPEKKWWKIWK